MNDMEDSGIKMHAIEMKRRSLPQTPAPSVADNLCQLPSQTTLTMVPRSVSMVSLDDHHDYADVTESLEESHDTLVERRRERFRSLREEISSAGIDELRNIMSNLVGTLESGLVSVHESQSSQAQQTRHRQPGVTVSDTDSCSTFLSCPAAQHDELSAQSTLSSTRYTVNSGSSGSKPDCPYNMTVQNVYNISNHGQMYFPGAAQGMQCGDYNSMYMPLQASAGNNADNADNDCSADDYENLTL